MCLLLALFLSVLAPHQPSCLIEPGDAHRFFRMQQTHEPALFVLADLRGGVRRLICTVKMDTVQKLIG